MHFKLLLQIIGLTALFMRPASAQPIASQTPEAEQVRQFPAAEIRAEFGELYRRLRGAHFNLYARADRAAYDRLYRRELAAIRRPETRFEIARRFQRFMAFGRVAHARIDFAYQAYSAFLAAGGRVFPLSLRIVGTRAFVIANRSGQDAVAVGDEVTAIDGRSIPTWLALWRRDLSADTDYMANALVELDLPALLWLEAGERPRFSLTMRGRRLIIPARTRAEMEASARLQPPRLDLGGREARMIGTIAYLRPGPFYNVEAAESAPYDNAGFRRFIDEAFERFVAAGSDRLIIDLRDNPGGDSSFSDLMVSWFATRPYRFNSAFRIRVSAEAIAANEARLASSTGAAAAVSRRFAALYARTPLNGIADFDTPIAAPREGRRFAGRVYVLVNRNSFSNAVAVAATIQDYRFGTIVGEETSDLATTYGAMETFTLPRTGLVVGFPKAEIVRPNGDLAARGVVPDRAIEVPLWEGRDDPVLRQLVEMIGGTGRSRAGASGSPGNGEDGSRCNAGHSPTLS